MAASALDDLDNGGLGAIHDRARPGQKALLAKLYERDTVLRAEIAAEFQEFEQRLADNPAYEDMGNTIMYFDDHGETQWK